jgi:hypothetical protein
LSLDRSFQKPEVSRQLSVTCGQKPSVKSNRLKPSELLSETIFSDFRFQFFLPNAQDHTPRKALPTRRSERPVFVSSRTPQEPETRNRTNPVSRRLPLASCKNHPSQCHCQMTEQR